MRNPTSSNAKQTPPFTYFGLTSRPGQSNLTKMIGCSWAHSPFNSNSILSRFIIILHTAIKQASTMVQIRHKIYCTSTHDARIDLNSVEYSNGTPVSIAQECFNSSSSSRQTQKVIAVNLKPPAAFAPTAGLCVWHLSADENQSIRRGHESNVYLRYG